MSQSIVKKVVRRLRGAPAATTPWVVAESNLSGPNGEEPQTLPSFRLFAIIGAWMEADVIGATVANARAQGCERVYLVDNNSHDDTVREAVSAGAVLARTFATEKYDEVLRLNIMNDVVAEVSGAQGDDHIWWLWLDADEFPHGPRGLTIREFLATLDRKFRIVGARFMNHYPSEEPAYIPGYHPLDFQPLCEEHRMGCALEHRKHSLQRFDRVGPAILCDRGFHRASSETRPLLEPNEAIYLHHFPYRAESVTRQRLATLCGTDEFGNTRVVDGDDAADGMVPRFATLDAVYRQDWKNVRNYRHDGAFSVAAPNPWNELVDEADSAAVRWYTPDDLASARRVTISKDTIHD